MRERRLRDREGCRERGVRVSGHTHFLKQTELRDGNPEYLKRVEWCINKRCELLKLNPPQRLEHGGSTELPPIRTEMQPELTRAQRFVRIAALLADGAMGSPDTPEQDRSGEPTLRDVELPAVAPPNS